MKNQQDDDQIDISRLFGALLEHKWIVLCSSLFFAVLGVAYAILAPAVYTANAVIQVEEKSSGGIFKEFSAVFDQASSASTEIAVLKSRMVLEKTVEELNLTTQIKPLFSIPFVSRGLAQLVGNVPDMAISHFVPMKKEYENLILEVGPTSTSYRLYNNDEKLLFEGVLNHKYVTDDFTIQVTILNARLGQRFEISKIDELIAIEELQKTLSISEKGKQTGVIEVAMNGNNSRQIRQIVKSVSENYILQNIARNSEEAAKSLEFLQTRLPEVRERLSLSEDKLNDYQQRNGTVDLNMEARSIRDTLVQVESDLSALSIKESELSKKFTKKHPTYAALLEQRRLLQLERKRLIKQMESLPLTQKETVGLTRDLEVDQQIYIQLSNKIQELDVVKAGVVGNVRILDVSQVMPRPIAPKKAIVVALATILGLIFGIAWALVKTLFSRGIESTEKIETLGLPVYATIPYSRNQSVFSLDKLRKSRNKLQLLSEQNPADLSIEALRSLRTSLHFAMMDTNNNVVMFTGASPEVGKSFVSANLANVIAQTGQKVLLIDADLRKSYLRYLLNLEQEQGLVESLTQNVPFEQVIQTSDYGFDVITKGVTPPNPAEVLANVRCQQLLQWASENYDLVIVDTPPILAVTDAAIIGRYVGATFLIGRFEQTTVKEVDIARKTFERSGVAVKGFILNGVKRKATNRYDYYHYEYK